MAISRKPILARPVRKSRSPVKLRLDARTTITVGGMEFFPFWKRRYPMARVIA